MLVAADAVNEATARATCAGIEGCRPVWRGSRRTLAAAVLAIGKHESGYAGYVGTGHCDEGPKGMRCDNGQARTYWQTWKVACPAAWSAEPGSDAEIRAGAQCAARLLAGAYLFCAKPDLTEDQRWQRAFGRYAGQGCEWRGGTERVATLHQVLDQFGKIRPEQVEPTITLVSELSRD